MFSRPVSDDYATDEGILTVRFSPSTTSAWCIQVTVIGDFDIEDEETISFSLFPDQAGSVSNATLTVIDDPSGHIDELVTFLTVVLFVCCTTIQTYITKIFAPNIDKYLQEQQP